MGYITLPNTLTAGAVENINHVSGNFSAITAVVNGQIDDSNLVGGIAGTKLANGTITDTQLSATYSGYAMYRNLAERGGTLTSTPGPPYVAGVSGSMTAIGNNPQADGTVIYFDPADYAASGRTTKCRLRAQLFTNSVAPTVTFTVGLYPVTVFGGGSGAFPFVTTLGAVTSGSTVAFTTPGASNGGAQSNSGDFTGPTAGFYVIGVAVSGAAAANSAEAIRVQLQVRNT